MPSPSTASVESGSYFAFHAQSFDGIGGKTFISSTFPIHPPDDAYPVFGTFRKSRPHGRAILARNPKFLARDDKYWMSAFS
jgi:hypothetical protein